MLARLDNYCIKIMFRNCKKTHIDTTLLIRYFAPIDAQIVCYAHDILMKLSDNSAFVVMRG